MKTCNIKSILFLFRGKERTQANMAKKRYILNTNICSRGTETFSS